MNTATSITSTASETMPRHRILVVDDDLRLRDLLKRYLTEQGFAVDTVPDGQALDRAFTRARYDLVVLDVMLPGEDGIAICRRIRAGGASDAAEANIPIIMLTAKGDDVDRIVGLEMGADDYLAKPFNPRELVARINAVLRRQAPLPTPGAPAATDVVVNFGPFSLNLGTRALTRDGAPIPMTTGEFGLLKVLAEHPRVPLSRDKLTELARGREHDSFDRAIDVQVSRLRKLLGEDPANPRYIQTVWGRGYTFVPEGRAES
jgi:two-component system, OmpR family, phosphate regulon response regulator OmpR